MTRAQRLMITSGLLILLSGMAFGLFYALFAEHQALNGMGLFLSTGMADAAQGNLATGQQSLSQYAEIRHGYIRNVHAHSHWSSLGIFLILLGLSFRSLRYDEHTAIRIALLLVYGSAAFPAGVYLAALQYDMTAKFFSISGTLSLLGGLGAYASGLWPHPHRP